MEKTTFITLHSGRAEWHVNVANIAAIRKSIEGQVLVYMLGITTPFYVNETIEEIKDIIKQSNQ